MADIVLVYPRTGFDIPKLSVDMPLSILSAASLAILDFDINLIDQRIDSHWENRLRDELKKNPLCVGVSAMTGKQISYGLQAAKIVREANPQTKIVWGGVHPTLLPEQTLKSQYVDIVVCGEGEETLRDLAHALERCKDLSLVEGIAFKKNGQIILTSSRKPLNLNQLPALPYHLLKMESYIGSQGRFGSNSARSLIYISSRGCPWRCTFCCNPRLSARRWRSIDAERVFEQVSRLKEEYNLNAVTFHDEEFLVNKERAEKIAQLINGKINWWIQARMDRLLEANLEKLAAGGLTGVQPGIESGSNRILKIIKKGETVEKIRAANLRLASTPIIPLYNFMMGFPHETKDELNMTIDLALELLQKNPNAEISGFYVFVPYPGTELFDLAVKNGFESPRSLEEWASYDRQHLKTPWIQEKRKELENLIFTAKLADGKRIIKRAEQLAPFLPLPRGLFNFITGRIRKKWKRHDYDSSWDIQIIKWLSRRYLN